MQQEELNQILALHEEWVTSAGASGTRADLAKADLQRLDLRYKILRLADMRGANMRGADMSDADMRGAGGLPQSLVVPNLDQAILAAIEAGGVLDMSSWHAEGTCGTTHSRAGWAITLAGPAGRLAEELYGPAAAGAIIYAASRPNKPVPDFYADTADAMASIRADAAEAAVA